MAKIGLEIVLFLNYTIIRSCYIKVFREGELDAVCKVVGFVNGCCYFNGVFYDGIKNLL